MRSRTIILLSVVAIVIWFLYLERAILTPFIIAGIFAYLFNPLVNLLSKKIKVPRSLSIIVIYLLIIGFFIYITTLLTSRILSESSDFLLKLNKLITVAREQTTSLPDWLAPTVKETLYSIQRSHTIAPSWFVARVPMAFERVISFLVFLFAAFYFLKDGNTMIDTLLNSIPDKQRHDLSKLLDKINAVLNGYLRGQIFMTALIAIVLYIGLSIIGVHYAVILAIFSGLAEIVPIIGPITATLVAVSVVLLSDSTFNFALNQTQAVMVIGIFYTIVRQLQDYFVTPHIMGRITKLHPLLILFAVLAGGHVWGILGVITAVPLAATLRIVFIEYLFPKMIK